MKANIYCYISGEIRKFHFLDCPAFFGYDRLILYAIEKVKEEKEKEINEQEEKKNEEACPKEVNFLFVLSKDLKNKDFYRKLSDKFVDKYVPLVSIGLYDISNEEKIDTFLPHNFLDSSIWNYYITVDSNKKTSDKLVKVSDKLVKVIEIIQHNYAENLYHTKIAREFIELNYRLLKNSYLEANGGHANAVVPFVFHSEYEMKKKARKILDEINKIIKIQDKTDNKIKLQWNVLLLDDYANNKLGTVGKTKKNTKKDVFDHVTGNFFENYNKKSELNYKLSFIGDKDSDDNIQTVESISAALERIVEVKKEEKDKKDENKTQYDIILLDYLLGRPNPKKLKREYGHEFLEQLKDKINKRDVEKEEKIIINKGPLGRFWIFPISSFNNAMLSKLREKGIEKINDDWYIMEGADMVNTPNLFIYNFYKLIQLQLKQAFATKKDIVKFIMLNRQVNKKDFSKIREFARKLYGQYMHKFGVREALKQDAVNGSAFAKSVLKHIKEKGLSDVQFYENVRKLIYLIGYGNHYDTPQMQRVFLSIISEIDNELIKKLEDEDDKEIINPRKEIKIFLENIQYYINELVK